jgi:PAS domain S-box-containing protein
MAMQFQENPFLPWQLIAAAITFGLGVSVLSQRRKRQAAVPFAVLMFALAAWSFSNALQLLSPGVGWQNFWNLAAYLGVAIAPTAWFLFTVQFTGIGRSRIEKRAPWFWLAAGLFYLLIFTNPLHQLYFRFSELRNAGGFVLLAHERGVLFSLHAAYSYSLFLAGFLLMGFKLFDRSQQVGSRLFPLMIGVLVPFLGNILYLAGALPENFPDPTPIAFTVTGLVFAWAVFGERILEAVSIAHDRVIQDLVTGVAVLDVENRILDINPAASQYLGIPLRKAVERSLLDMLPRRSAFRAALESGLAHGSGSEAELTVYDPGRKKTYQLLISVIQDQVGRDSGRLLQLNDISRARLAEESLATTRQTFYEILDTLQDNYFEADPIGRLTYVNQAFTKNIGFSEKEIVGKHALHFVHRRSRRTIFEHFQQVYATRQPLISAEYEYTHRDGSERIAEVSVSPILEGEKVVGTRGIIRDITDRISTNRQLRLMGQIVRQMKDAVILTDNDAESRIRFVNKAFTQLYGYTEEEVLGQPSRMLYGGDGQDYGQMAAERTEVVTAQGEFQAEYQDRRKDGSLFWVANTSSDIHLGDEGNTYDLGILRDITARVMAEQRLKEAKEAAEIRAGELAAINRVAVSVNHSLNLVDVLQTVCQELVGVFAVRSASISLLDPDGESLEVVAYHSSTGQDTLTVGRKTALQESSDSWKAVQTHKTVTSAGSGEMVTAMDGNGRKAAQGAMMILPLVARGRAIGLIEMPAKERCYVFTSSEIELAETIASQIATAVDHAQLYMRTESARDIAERDLEIGREIQSGFFPEAFPDIPGWEIAAHFQAARQVAGDFYDVFQFKNSNLTAFIIADVCDKGVGAALFMVLFRSLLRAYSPDQFDLDRAEEQLGRIVLSVNNFIAEIHGRSSMFATLFYGVLEPESGTLYYVNGGHEPPLVLDKDGAIRQRLMPTGPAVGFFPNIEFRVERIQLEKGDILVSYTDGTTDALNSAEELFTEQRLLRLIKAPWTSIFSMIFELNVNLVNHIGQKDQYDDITLLAFRRKQRQEINHHAICRVARPEILGELRDFAERAAAQSGLGGENVLAFKLAAEEICSNIIQYGFEGREPGFIVLAFERRQEKATMSIWDDGRDYGGYGFSEKEPGPAKEAGWESRELGGWGIPLVKGLMDQVTYRKEPNQTNVLVMERGV